jgi:hypothetical protein
MHMSVDSMVIVEFVLWGLTFIGAFILTISLGLSAIYVYNRWIK